MVVCTYAVTFKDQGWNFQILTVTFSPILKPFSPIPFQAAGICGGNWEQLSTLQHTLELVPVLVPVTTTMDMRSHDISLLCNLLKISQALLKDLPDESKWMLPLLYVRYIDQSETAIIEVVCVDVKIRGMVQNKVTAIGRRLWYKKKKHKIKVQGVKISWLCPKWHHIA